MYKPVQGDLLPDLVPLWRVGELADYLGLSPITVIRKARSGKWPSRRPGRSYLFSPGDVEAIVRMTRRREVR